MKQLPTSARGLAAASIVALLALTACSTNADGSTAAGGATSGDQSRG